MKQRPMKKEYDFSSAARGPVVSHRGKSRITIYIDDEILDEFRKRGDASGRGYQTMMNAALREYLGKSSPPIDVETLRRVIREEWKSGMKTKTSVTLSEEVLRLIDQNAQGEKNRSAFIETAVRAYLEVVKRRGRDQEDLSIINRLSEKLNSEATDVLGYQAEK